MARIARAAPAGYSLPVRHVFPPALPLPTAPPTRAARGGASLGAARALTLVVVVGLVSSAGAAGPILHERIPPDPREDVALTVSLDGDLPAALQTRSGLVSAPELGVPDDPKRSPYSPSAGPGGLPDATFTPDRDTKKPDTLPYDEPFRPSTAPFKRLAAYDAVDDNFMLFVRSPRLTPVSLRSGPVIEATEETFYADLVVDLAPGDRSRIPTVGAGTRIVKARAGVGSQDVPFRIGRDGAENWFVGGDTPTRVRLVMQLAAPRASFGGTFGVTTWDRLPKVPPLPPRVAAAQEAVARTLGLGRHLPPHENVARMVAYFRSFEDSADSPPQVRDIYTDLVLSKKGVCRHRAFAFLITSLGLGIPARMIANEAHAWVEVHDGQRFVRIDLGGAGNTLRDPLSSNVPFEPPPDPFSWPVGASRGDDLGARARAPGPQAPGSEPGFSAAPGSSGALSSSSPSSSATASSSPGADTRADGTSPTSLAPRPAAGIALRFAASTVSRGGRLEASGQVIADGEPCGRVPVELVLREKGGHETTLGALATDPEGRYSGGVALPRSLRVGDYDVFARTSGDARCGKGASK